MNYSYLIKALLMLQLASWNTDDFTTSGRCNLRTANQMREWAGSIGAKSMSAKRIRILTNHSVVLVRALDYNPAPQEQNSLFFFKLR